MVSFLSVSGECTCMNVFKYALAALPLMFYPELQPCLSDLRCEVCVSLPGDVVHTTSDTRENIRELPLGWSKGSNPSLGPDIGVSRVIAQGCQGPCGFWLHAQVKNAYLAANRNYLCSDHPRVYFALFILAAVNMVKTGKLRKHLWDYFWQVGSWVYL